jgi:hypothetical protein
MQHSTPTDSLTFTFQTDKPESYEAIHHVSADNKLQVDLKSLGFASFGLAHIVRFKIPRCLLFVPIFIDFILH